MEPNRPYTLDDREGGAGCRRRSPLNRNQCRIVHGWDREMRWNRKRQQMESILGKHRLRKGSKFGKDGRCIDRRVNSAQRGFKFRRILHRLQIICGRDNGKKNQQEEEERSHLGSPICAIDGGMANPQAHNGGCEHSPNEIENQFHVGTILQHGCFLKEHRA